VKTKRPKLRKPTLAETMRNREIVAGVAQGTYSRNAEVESVALSQTASSKEIQWL
jgi:hypothetical protein